MIDDAKFFAWLDGELGPAEAAEVEAKVSVDPELTRVAEEHRSLKRHLRGAFDPIAKTPVPEPLQAALRPSGEIIDFAAAKRARIMPSAIRWAAMAAPLALGVIVGTMVP